MTSDYIKTKHIFLKTTLPKGRFVIIPTTFKYANLQLNYRVTIPNCNKLLDDLVPSSDNSGSC